MSDTLGLRVAVRATKMLGGYFENLARAQTYTTRDVALGGLATVHQAPVSEDESPGGHDLLGRATLKWTPDSRLAVTLKVSGFESKVNDAGWNAVLFRCPTGTSQQNPLVKCGPQFVYYHNKHPLGLAAVQDYANRDGSLGNQYRSWNTTGTVNYDLDNVVLTSVTNYNANKNTWQLDGDFTSASRASAFHR